MSTLARNGCREMLRYDYTQAEHLEKGKALAAAHSRLAAEEAHLDRIKADFKAKLATITEEASQLLSQVQSGYELREYVCFWTFDDPAKGRKTLRRKEPPQEIVREEEMTIADRQTVMDAIDAAAKEQQQAPLTLEAFDAIDGTKVVMGTIEADLQSLIEHTCDCVLNADNTLKSESESRLFVLGMIQDMGFDYVSAFGDWLRLNISAPSGCVIPGASIALAAVEHELGNAKAKLDGEKAKAKEQKKSRAKKADQSGTVDLPSDEGSRDDAGENSKNDL